VIRRVVAGIACVLAPIVLVTAVMLWWANRTVLDSDHVAGEVDAALSEPEVVSALTSGILTRLPPDPAVQAAAQRIVPQVIGTPMFRNVMSNAVRASHSTLVLGEQPDVVLDLTNYLDELQAEVAAVDPAAAAAIPTTTELRLLIAERSQLPAVWEATTTMRRVVPALIVIGLSLTALGLVLAIHRGRWLIVAALIGVLLAAGLWAAVRLGEDSAVDGIADPAVRTPADNLLNRVTTGLNDQLLVILGVATLTILIGMIVAWIEPDVD
jgi:hypothetical protein